MAKIPGTNCWTESEDALLDMLADSVEFQSWVSETTAKTAKANKIFVDSLPGPTEFPFSLKSDTYTQAAWDNLGNYALVTTPPEGFSFEFSSVSSTYDFLAQGFLLVEFNRYFSLANIKLEEDARTSKNEIGDILEAIMKKAGDFPYLGAIRFGLIDYGWNIEDQEPAMSRWFVAEFAIEWSSGNIGTPT